MNLLYIATRIATLVSTGEIIVYLADDEQEADRLSATVRALLPRGRVFHVKSSDSLPGESAPASPANAGHRVAALRASRAAMQGKDHHGIACILSGEAAARRYPPPGQFDAALPCLQAGDTLLPEDFAASVEALGYFTDDRVDEPGEVAIRGAVIDIFPADAALPARIELAGDRISAIRSYDPLTQRTVDDLAALEIGRAIEPSPDPAVAILEHLRPGVIACSDKAERRRKRFVQLAHDAASGDATVDAVEDKVWKTALNEWRPIAFEDGIEPVPRFAATRSPAQAFRRFVRPLLADRAFVLAGGERDLRFLRPRVARRLDVELPVIAEWAGVAALSAGTGGSIQCPADGGFVDDRTIVVAAADLLGSRALADERALTDQGVWAGNISDIRAGDVVVHEDHGVALVVGLEHDADGPGPEMIVLEFAGGTRRLVACSEADRIWRYGADADAVKFDKLDGSSWQKRRRAIDAAIAETARALVELAKTRADAAAPLMVPDPGAYEKFADTFPFTETADQVRAIAAVRDDLASGRPMDRLVVGDVGYGKTEVALRAAALAALSGHQVSIAAPTTVLVRQHIETFRRRFEGTGITIAGLSRLSTAAERKTVKAGLADGSIKIVIGTGAVRGKGMTYARLGLVVIDEEQRFGAADKVRLRGTGDTHLLTLTATPIPRTLQAALVGLQDMSLIATPPALRQPIRTSIDDFDETRIRTALMREKGRGGQSFVVVPRIQDMAALAETLSRAVPELVVVQAHGKLPAAKIDEVMVGFAEGCGDILLATNIIEAGLDVPRANTMIVWRADRFGLAQLHQLRGRVGRGNRRGQVLLLADDVSSIGERTLKRLRTLAAFDRLGAGFDISAQDLDMRGAGDLLGDDQAGHTKLIGIDLYQHLLGAAVRQARGEVVERWSPELNLGTTGTLPAAWIPDEDLRLTVYARLSRIVDEAALDALEEELIDRFGPLPPPAADLIDESRLRLAARALRIVRVDAGAAAIALTPRRDFAADALGNGLREKNGRWLLDEQTDDGQRVARVQALLERLAD